MAEFQTQYLIFEKQRQELANAEKLFDLPITKYDLLIEVDRDLRNMTKVYELYDAQKVIIRSISKNNFCGDTHLFVIVLQVAREDWSGTLWANLNIEQLTEGIDGFMRSLRKFPKEVKALPICHILEERMREFKDSIPLFADLKNDALRDRYI